MIQQKVVPNRFKSDQGVGLPGESQVSKPLRELTYRERAILTLAARGFSNERIAAELGISSPTVKCTMRHACIKLGASSRLEAVYRAVVEGYLALDEILSFDDLILVFKSLSPQALHETAKRLKQRQFDELVNLLAPFELTTIQKAARVLKQKQGQLQLPPISSNEGYRRP